MAFKNEIILSGKALKDSERSGNGPWRFCIVQGGGKKRDSEERWPKEFFNCEAWSNVEGADRVKAGEVIYVEGRLKQREWTNEQNEKRKSYSILCSIVHPHHDEPNHAPPSPESLGITDKDIPF